MAYITPKTNWEVRISGGVYVGDFLNASDYTRIIGNIDFIHDACEAAYGVTIPETSMPSRSINDIPLASDFNTIEDNIQSICENFFFPSTWTTKKTYYTNGQVPLVSDWNRWESTILAFKQRLDYDANWVGFITSDSENFIDANGDTFQVMDI